MSKSYGSLASVQIIWRNILGFCSDAEQNAELDAQGLIFRFSKEEIRFVREPIDVSSKLRRN